MSEKNDTIFGIKEQSFKIMVKKVITASNSAKNKSNSLSIPPESHYRAIPEWLNDAIKDQLRARGIRWLYQPQYEAISKYFENQGKNMVVSIPTASGKTLIAEIIIFQTLLQRLPKKTKAVYIAPQRSIVFEVYRKFTAIWKDYYKIVNSVGDYGEGDEKILEADVIIMTNEKADSIIRINPNFMNAISVLIVDEAHILGEGERGQTLEFLLSRILYTRHHQSGSHAIKPPAELKNKPMPVEEKCRVVCLSATIGNIESFSEWLSAILIKSDWRPTKLIKGIYLVHTPYYAKEYLESKSANETCIPDNPFLEYATPLLNLIKSLIDVGNQAIIFVNTRREAEDYCEFLQRALTPEDLFDGKPTRVDFHNAGRTIKEQKKLIEAFERKEIKFIISKSTKAAGINLPAKFVIIAGVKRFAGDKKYITYSVNQYLQMAGRAGRPDFGSKGFSVILSNSKNEALEMFEKYCCGNPEALESQISAGELSKHILGLVDAKIIRSLPDAEKFFKSTFYYKTNMQISETVRKKIKEILTQLRKKNFIISDKELIEQSTFSTTKFGSLATKLYITPNTAYQMRIMIQQIIKFPDRYCPIQSKGYKLPKELFYNIICHTENAYTFHFKPSDFDLIWAFLEQFKQRLFYSYEDFLADLTNYYHERNPLNEYRNEFQRELTAIKGTIILKLYSDGISVAKIAELTSIGKGDVYASIMQADWLIHALYNLCIHFGLLSSSYFTTARQDFMDANKSLSLGVPEELFDVMRIPSIGRLMAKELYQLGYHTIQDIANIDSSQFLDSEIKKTFDTIKKEARELSKRETFKETSPDNDLSHHSVEDGSEIVHRIVSTDVMMRAMDE